MGEQAFPDVIKKKNYTMRIKTGQEENQSRQPQKESAYKAGLDLLLQSAFQNHT